MKRMILPLIAAAGLNAQAAEPPLFTGDKKLACEAVLCLAATGTRPGECLPSIRRYFSINLKRWSDTVKARANFLAMCPAAGGIPPERNPDEDETILENEYRVLTCAQAAATGNRSYGLYINNPTKEALAIPDGWVSKRLGQVVAVAQGGWANLPIYNDRGTFVGWGYALEVRTAKKNKATGEVLETTEWWTSKTGNCTMGNPETYEPPSGKLSLPG
jgi:hypothetical protein